MRVVDGGEPVEFKGLFKEWEEKYEIHGVNKTAIANRTGKQTIKVTNRYC